MSGLWILLLVTIAVVCVWLLADEGVSHRRFVGNLSLKRISFNRADNGIRDFFAIFHINCATNPDDTVRLTWLDELEILQNFFN